jgi:hypothetical protein
MNSRRTVTGQPTPTIKDTKFKPGHPYFPPRQLSVRQQRRRVAAALGKAILKMAAQIDAGESVDMVNYTRSIHTWERMQAEL